MTPKRLRIILWALVAINLGALAWVGIVAPRMNQRVVDTLGQGDYRLELTSGGTFTQETLEDGPSAIFFGFTHCPDVCPTTLGDILTWQTEIEGADALNVYFVTVDPERDTAEVLGEYVSWVPGVEGVTGSPEEVQRALQSFRIYAAKVPTDDGTYTMDHSASVMLFDARGRYVSRIRYQEEIENVREKLADVLPNA